MWLYRSVTDESTWRQDKKATWNSTLLFSDRVMALGGSAIFAFLLATGLVTIPVSFVIWYFSTDNQVLLTIMAFVCFIMIQLVLAYGRQSYFYDSYGTYMFLIVVLILPLILLFSLSFFSLSSIDKSGIISSSVNFVVTAFQLVELVLMCVNI
jgi:hypothetical protein